MGCKKQSAKNRVIVIQKEKRQPGCKTYLNFDEIDEIIRIHTDNN